MKIFLVGYFLFICNCITNGYCPDDGDLQRHQCRCNLVNNYIQCSSLPNQCRTCYRYKALFFDEKVDLLPVEAFRFYNFFDDNHNKKNLFKIQFAQINNISINTFSKININQERTLEIKIFKYSSSIIPTRVFEDITIQTKAKINIEIFNITQSRLTIEQYAFDGIKFNYQSQFRLSILNAKDTIEFESNAGSILLPSYSYMELYFTNFIQILLNEHSFDHITQEQSSELIINFNHFQSTTLSHNSFYDFHQFEQSRFHLSLSNFQSLTIEQTLFDTITQLNSFLIISIYNLTNDLCLPNKTFSQIKQNLNSTFQFEINSIQNILFTTNSFINIKQYLQSNLLITITNSFDVYFSRYSFNNFHQENRSVIDISVKSGQNLIFEDYAIYNIDIYRSSILKIGFQYGRGTLQMATNAFSQINEGQGGELLFQIMNSSDFYFRFNQSISLQRLEIIDRLLSSNDLCRISNIPSHVPVKLLYDNQCSCTIYYLYRHLHHKLLPSILKDITPICYYNMSLDEIEYAENECSFKNKIYNCQQMDGEIQINIPQGMCQIDFKLNQVNNNNSKQNSSFSSFIFFLLILSCCIFSITCIYVLLTNKRRSSWDIFSKHRRQKLSSYSTDSYHQESRRKLIVTNNSTTDQSEDITLKLNTNPMSDIEDSLL